MAAFATVEQYLAVYDSSQDEDRIAAVLEKASRKIRAAMREDGLSWEDPDDELAASLADVCCDMAHRALGEDRPDGIELPFGATQTSVTAGPYSQSVSLGNPYGDLFLTRSERDLLGIGIPAIGSIQPMVHGGGDSDD